MSTWMYEAMRGMVRGNLTLSLYYKAIVFRLAVSGTAMVVTAKLYELGGLLKNAIIIIKLYFPHLNTEK